MGGTKQFLELKNTVKDVEDKLASFKEDSFREEKKCLLAQDRLQEIIQAKKE